VGIAADAKLIAWSDHYSVGIHRIDAQHRTLVELINELHAAVVAGDGNEALAQMLEGVAAHVASHFATEETLMKKFDYPGYGWHKAEHERLMAHVKLAQEKTRANQTAFTPEVMTYLHRWLLGHIVNVDKRYTAHLKAAGVM
jgi:hemerythrin